MTTACRARVATIAARARDIDAARSAYPAPVLERREDEPPLSLVDDDADEIEEARGRSAGVCRRRGSWQETGPELSEAEESSEIERVVEHQEPGMEICDVAPVRDRALLSDESAATVASKFQALAAGVAFSESDVLDRCAKEMLQPILQQWLEANLPVARGAAGARRNRADRAACKPPGGLGAQIESALTTL